MFRKRNSCHYINENYIMSERLTQIYTTDDYFNRTTNTVHACIHVMA